MKITTHHKKILKAQICPYCGSKPELIDSVEVYGKSYGMMYICKSCDAYVGCHGDSDRPLGRLANKELREWKRKAHSAFDPIWKNGKMKRQEAYKWLSKKLDIPPKYTHIGMFSEKTCKRLIRIVNGEHYVLD